MNQNAQLQPELFTATNQVHCSPESDLLHAVLRIRQLPFEISPVIPYSCSWVRVRRPVEAASVRTNYARRDHIDPDLGTCPSIFSNTDRVNDYAV